MRKNHLTGTVMVRILPGCYFDGKESSGEIKDLPEAQADFVVNRLRIAEYYEPRASETLWPIFLITAVCGVIILIIS